MNSRILQLCLSPNLGGLELYMQRLSLYLHSQAQTHICIAEHSKLDASFCEFPATQKLRLRKHAWKNIFKNAKHLASYIDTNKIDVVHMHWTKDLPLCVFAKHLSQRKPKLIQSRHMNMTRFKGDFYHRHLYKNIDLMIAVTEQVKQQIIRFVPDEICPPIKVSYIGAPTYKELSEDSTQALRQQYRLDDNFVVALAGRIEPAKGQALLVEALEELDKSNIQVLLIGDAMEEDYLQQLKNTIDNKGLASQIVFTGFVNNVQNLMAVSDCVVLATDKETFGMVLVEAMHTGTAVLASNSGGPLEIIDSNKNGLLFSSGDAYDLAKQLNNYIENNDFRAQLANAGKEKAALMFESKKQFKEILSLLQQS